MSRPAFSICLCPDSHLLRNRLDTLLAAHPSQEGASASSWQRFAFWGDEGLPGAFWEHLTLQGLFATPKALVIRNAQNLPTENLKQLSAALEPLAVGRGAQLVWPLLCLEGNFEKGGPKVPAHILRLPCYQTAEKRGWLDITPGLTVQTMPAYIRAEAARHGLKLRPQESAMLTGAFPPDAALIGSELAKLALTADVEGHLPANAATLVGQTQELGIFELMRSVQQQSNAPAVWRQILEDRLSGENMVFAFIAILLREGRVLWQTLSGDPPFLPSQVAMQKKLVAQSLGFSGIARVWELALMADKGIKTGERSPDQAFEILAADLFTLFRAGAGR